MVVAVDTGDDEVVAGAGGEGVCGHGVAGRVEEACVGASVGCVVEAVFLRFEGEAGVADRGGPVEDVVDGVPVLGGWDVDGVFVVDADLGSCG